MAAAFCTSALIAAPATASAAGLMAPASACPRTPTSAQDAAQEEAMLCLTDYARSQVGAGPLEETSLLQESAADKAADIFNCDSFSHYACGREFTYWMRSDGYLSTPCWLAGENLAFGTGSYGSVASIFRAWLRSTEHRENLLDAEFTQVGISLRTGELEGSPGTHVWAQHFGTHC
jgi:uncharacterized protein YkwD